MHRPLFNCKVEMGKTFQARRAHPGETCRKFGGKKPGGKRAEEAMRDDSQARIRFVGHNPTPRIQVPQRV